MDYVAKFAVIAQKGLDFFLVTMNSSVIAPFDKETLKPLFWIGANYHPDTQEGQENEKCVKNYINAQNATHNFQMPLLFSLR